MTLTTRQPSGSGTLIVNGDKQSMNFGEGVREHKKGVLRNTKSASEADIEQGMFSLASRSFGMPPDIVDFSYV